jgi:hypothetical protein
MRNDWILRIALVAGASTTLIGSASAQANGGGTPRPYEGPPNEWDQSIAAIVVHCGDPGHCPPIHPGIVPPPKENEVALIPYIQELAGPDARVLAGHIGGLLADPSLLQARRDSQAWALFDPDGSGFGQGARLGFVGSTHFGERVVLAETSPGTRLGDPEIDKRASAIVMAATIGAAAGRTAAIGIWYDGQTWWAYDEAGANLPAGERVIYLDAADRGGRAKHEAANDFGGIGIVLDDPRLNGKPDVVVIAQHAFHQVRNASPLAAFYDQGLARWIVYNADGSQLALDETVHFIIGS